MCYSGKCDYESYDGECILKTGQRPPLDAGCVQHQMEVDIHELGIVQLIQDILDNDKSLEMDVYNVIVNQIANCYHHKPITVVEKLPVLMRLTIIKDQLKNIEIKYEIQGTHKRLDTKCESTIRDIIMEAW